MPRTSTITKPTVSRSAIITPAVSTTPYTKSNMTCEHSARERSTREHSGVSSHSVCEHSGARPYSACERSAREGATRECSTREEAKREDAERFQHQLGRRLKGIRELKGLSQASVGKSIDLSRVAVGYIEQGRRAPSLATLGELARLYGMTISELCDVDADRRAEIGTDRRTSTSP